MSIFFNRKPFTLLRLLKGPKKKPCNVSGGRSKNGINLGPITEGRIKQPFLLLLLPLFTEMSLLNPLFYSSSLAFLLPFPRLIFDLLSIGYGLLDLDSISTVCLCKRYYGFFLSFF